MARRNLVQEKPKVSKRDFILQPLVALLVVPDKAAAGLKEIFEDVACDWRLIIASDGSEAARQIMAKGLPDLLVTMLHLPKINGADLAEWIRSFGHSSSIPILVIGEPQTTEEREQLLRNSVQAIRTAIPTRDVLIGHLAEIVTRIEKRRFASVATV